MTVNIDIPEGEAADVLGPAPPKAFLGALPPRAEKKESYRNLGKV